MPRLKHLDLSLGPDLTVDLLESIFPSTASLTSLRFRDHYVQLLSYRMDRQITTLDLYINSDGIWNRLLHFPNLKSLTVCATDGVEVEDIPKTPTTLPFLRTLVIAHPSDAALLSGLQLPALFHLQVGLPLNLGSRTQARVPHGAFKCLKPIPSVQILTVEGWNIGKVDITMLRLLKALPGLEEFTAHDVLSGGGIFPDVFSDPTICPKLRVCDVNGRSLIEDLIELKNKGGSFGFDTFGPRWLTIHRRECKQTIDLNLLITVLLITEVLDGK